MHATSTLFAVLASLSLLALPITALPAPSRGDGLIGAGGSAGAGAGGITAPFGGDRGTLGSAIGAGGAAWSGDQGVQGDFGGTGGQTGAGRDGAAWPGKTGAGAAAGAGGGQVGRGSGITSGFAKRQSTNPAPRASGAGCKAKSIAGATNYWSGSSGSSYGGRKGQSVSDSTSASGATSGSGSTVTGSSSPDTDVTQGTGQDTSPPASSDSSAAPTPSTAPAPAPIPSNGAAPESSPLPSAAPAPQPSVEAAPAPAPSVEAAPAPSPSASAAPAPPATGGSGGDYAGVGPYTGQGTYYDAGLGACGITNTNADDIVALSMKLWDSWPGATTNPNQNPICGRQIQISWGGKTATATVTDRCEGCALRDVDMTPTLFQKFAPLGLGRMGVNSEPLTWNWV